MKENLDLQVARIDETFQYVHNSFDTHRLCYYRSSVILGEGFEHRCHTRSQWPSIAPIQHPETQAQGSRAVFMLVSIGSVGGWLQYAHTISVDVASGRWMKYKMRLGKSHAWGAVVGGSTSQAWPHGFHVSWSEIYISSRPRMLLSIHKLLSRYRDSVRYTRV